MKWSNIPNGYEFRVHMNHGNYSANIEEVIRCSLDEKEFEKHINVLQHLVKAVDKNISGYTEDVAKFIEEKTSIPEKEIMMIIQNVIMSDIKWEEHMARPEYIEVFRYENGSVKKSQLN